MCVLGLQYIWECTECSPGAYCQGYGNEQPDANCSARYYCSGNASVAAPTDGVTGDVCPAGHYCPLGSGQPIPCEDGTYTDTTLNEECLQCTPGHYCTNGVVPVDCPAGYYCPKGTGHVWQACPTGTFSAATGLANETQCTLCTAGYFCDELNATAVSGPCDPGHYCRSGAATNTPTASSKGDAGVCPMGHWCGPQTGEPNDCPAGTFNNGTGLTAVDECQSCLPGYYCDVPGLSFPTGLCEPGFYCMGGSNSSNPTTETSTGGPCPPGTYCEEGSSLAVLCDAGTYNPISMQANCTDCPSGYYCEAGATNITDCPMGECSWTTQWSITLVKNLTILDT